MTAMADLGLVTDAAALLVELADRLGVEVPAERSAGGRRTGAASGAGRAA